MVRPRFMRSASNTNRAAPRAKAQANAYGSAFAAAHTQRRAAYSHRFAKSDFLFFLFPATPTFYIMRTEMSSTMLLLRRVYAFEKNAALNPERLA